MATPEPNRRETTPSTGRGPGRRGGLSPVPIVVVVLALIVVAAIYISVRNQPNYQEEGELGDQPAPVETST